MTTIEKFLLVIVAFSLLAGITRGAVNCNAPLKFRPPKDCCRMPDPDSQAFPECFKYSPGRNTFACPASCIVNSTSALDGDRLNIPNLRAAFVRLFKFDDNILDGTVIPAFKECEKEFDTFSAQNKKWHGDTRSECPMLPFMYFTCAAQKAMVNCPSNLWNSSDKCETLKDYILNCDGIAQSQRNFFERRGGRMNRGRVQFI